MMKNKMLLGLCIIFSTTILAQIPQGYYNGTQGLTGDSLRYKLHDIISNGYVQGTYADLWTSFQTTDKRTDGKVWDMYSDIPNGTPPYLFTFVTNQCGGYSAEGDCYNREHTVPESWFNGAYPMYSDLFHLVPTDGYVNNRRSNYPFGDVSNASWTSLNGSKLGTCSDSGYTGTVFEPIDSFKGDFARIYFYMATRYKDEIPSWSSSGVFSGNNLSPWSKKMFLQWNSLDPVSMKEIHRNDSAYKIQHNRNPYVDHPEWVNAIWNTGQQVYYTALPDISFFPNPASHYLHISVSTFNDIITINLYDELGRCVWTSKKEQPNDIIPVFYLKNGIYYLSVTGYQITLTKKIIVLHD